jgi:hypothetical protein
MGTRDGIAEGVVEEGAIGTRAIAAVRTGTISGQ